MYRWPHLIIRYMHPIHSPFSSVWLKFWTDCRNTTCFVLHYYTKLRPLQSSSAHQFWTLEAKVRVHLSLSLLFKMQAMASTKNIVTQSSQRIGEGGDTHWNANLKGDCVCESFGEGLSQLEYPPVSMDTRFPSRHMCSHLRCVFLLALQLTPKAKVCLKEALHHVRLPGFLIDTKYLCVSASREFHIFHILTSAVELLREDLGEGL